MLWLVLFIISVVMFIAGMYLFDFSEALGMTLTGIGVVIGIISIIVVFIVIGHALDTYPMMLGRVNKVESLRNRIEDVRGAVYQTQHSKNAMLNGSIENFKQSTVLSEYIVEIAQLEAKYNSHIKKVKYYKNSGYGFWIMFSPLISDMVHTLPEKL